MAVPLHALQRGRSGEYKGSGMQEILCQNAAVQLDKRNFAVLSRRHGELVRHMRNCSTPTTLRAADGQ